MKRKFLSTAFSITLAMCLFGNTVFASELGSADVSEITVETEASGIASEEPAEESSEQSSEETVAAGVASEEPVEESSEQSGEETIASSEISEESGAVSEESTVQTVEEVIGESNGLTYTVEGDTVTITGEGACWTDGSELQTAIRNAKNIVFRDCKIQGSMEKAFYEDGNLQSIDLSGLDTSQVTNMSYMFHNCSNVSNLDTSRFNTSQVTDMGGMFSYCVKLTSLDVSSFDTSKVTNMKFMFWNCENLSSLDVSSFDTSRVTDMPWMFAVCRNLTSLDVSGFNTSQVTDMGNMFYTCEKLTSLDVSGFDTSQVTNMYEMFNSCTGLTNLNVSGFDTSKVTDMHGMFSWCGNLSSLDVSSFDTAQVTDMEYMFSGNSNLTSLDLSNFDMSNVTNPTYMLNGCKLEELRTPKALSAGCSIRLVNTYQTPDGVQTECLTPEFAGTTLVPLRVMYKVEGDTITIIGEGTGWTNGSEIKNAIRNAKHVGFKNCKIWGSMAYAFSECADLQSIDLAGLDTSRVTDMNMMFYGCSSLTSLDVSGLDTSRVSNMSGMFDNCKNLTSVNVSGFDTLLVTNMYRMFAFCSSLTSLDVSGFDTNNVTNMGMAFANCSSLTELDVSKFDTSNVTNMDYIFGGCSGLTKLDVSGFDTSKVTNMSCMFNACEKLKVINVSAFDTSKVTDMGGMFGFCSGLTELDVSGFDTSKVTVMGEMFLGCSNLTKLDVSGFNTSQVTDMKGMFWGCSGLSSLEVSGFDTSKVTSMQCMFSECSNLTSLDVSSFDTSKLENMEDYWGTQGMFEGCTSLKTLDLSSFDLSNVPADHVGLQRLLTNCSLQELRTPKALPTGCSIALGRDYQTPVGTITAALTPEFVSTTLKFVQVTPAPVKFTVAGVVGGRNVTFKSDTQDAVIYYSTKTSSITTNDTCVQNGETVLFENFYGTVYARPYLNGVWGNVSKLILKIPVVNTPVITVKGSEVSIKTTTGACTIYYTTDGSTPSPTNGKKLTKSAGSFTVTGSCTVKAIAVRSCFTNSAIASAQVKVSDTRPGAPSFGVKGVIGGREVTFNAADPKAEIYYSFTTSNITTKDKHVKAGEKVLFENYYGTVYAKAYLNGKWSNVSRLVLKIPTVNTPTITSAGNGKVKITTTTPNCIIYYTTDGSTPSPTNGRRVNLSSTVISVGAGKTVKAIAVRSCFTNSKVVTYKK